ncbi:MAG TPA: phasin family protein [Casimicrobiaceae bacterium]|nr:phasin family protein [Casimicrobiaceae bacterium]
MLKKAKAELGSEGAGEAKGLAQAILDSSHQIWLAGLGAFAKAQGGGVKVFETLVKQGEGLEAKTRVAAAQTADAARGAAKAKAREMQSIAGDTWDKLEQVFENRVARALGRLGVYSAADVKRLTERVDALSEAVNALLKSQGGKSASPAGRKRAASQRTKVRRSPKSTGSAAK